jgi:RNA polymerase sigma-70 factor, ECF subfamily
MSGKKEASLPDADLFFRMKEDKQIAEPAFTELYARHAGRVYAYCLRIMGEPNEAQDVFQEAFIRFYESVQRITTMTNVPGFILKIARNLCLNRRRDRKPYIHLDEVEDLLPRSPGRDTDVLELITMALDMLQEEYREVFVLREYEGLSYSEIAEVLDITVATVKIRVFRAKRQLRELLAPYMADLHTE